MGEIIDLRNKKTPLKRNKKNLDKQEESLSLNKLRWEADYTHHIIPSWRRGLFFLIAGLILLSIFLKQNIFVIIFFLLILFVFFLKTKINPKAIQIELSPHYLRFSNRIIPYKELRSFWISYDPTGVQELSLRRDAWYSLYLKIPINGQSPMHIRDFLLNYIPEEKHEDSILDVLGRGLGV